jgi:transcriptional regulator with XRE-family HTH domain
MNHIGQFGGLIRARRRLLNFTQEQLARQVRTSVPYIGHLESEKRHPSEKVIKRLAEALSLDPRELFFLANPGTKRLITRPQESDGASSAWEIFQNDENLRKIHNITDREMQALSGVALLGKIREPRDFIFILNAIRQALA